jgi:hypothetical protein
MSDDDQEESLSDEDGTEEGDDGNWDEEWGGVESEAEDDSESSPPLPDLPKGMLYTYFLILSGLTRCLASGAYVPPHLRKAKLDAAQPSEEVIKLTRQLKGLLNRFDLPSFFHIPRIRSKNPSLGCQNRTFYPLLTVSKRFIGTTGETVRVLAASDTYLFRC